MKNILLYIWQLPQNLLGLLLVWVYKCKHSLDLENGNIIYFSSSMSGGISLGKYSIISNYYWTKYKGNINQLIKLNIIKHKGIGHGKQSKYLGPLYLLIIGLPSLIWSWLYGSIIPYSKNGYYKFYTEKWADKLARIVR